jgi:hypothetical protein
MNINICLSTPLPSGYGSQIWIYADPTGVPPFNGTFVVGPIPTSSVSAPNCPYSVTVPNGTTVIRFIDEDGDPDCYTDIPVVPIEICEDCTFSFDLIDNNQIGLISVGNLVSSGTDCGVMSSYLIQWYDSTGTYQFSTGVGVNYSGLPVRNYTHPLTGSSAVPITTGQYYPVLVGVTIDNVNYSTVGTGGDLYVDLSDCNILPEGVSVIVENYTCEPSGTSDDPNYDHKVFFNSIGGSGTLPVVSSVALTPGNTTQYLAIKFKGDYFSDRLKVELFKQSTPNTPILLEDIIVGIQSNSGNINNTNLNSPSLNPKQIRTSGFFHKLIPLSGLSINTTTDYIKISVVPNSINVDNPATNWTLYFTCLETFNCDLCSDHTSGYKLCTSALTVTYNPNHCLYDMTHLEFDVINPCYPETNLDPKTYLGAIYPETPKNVYTYQTNGALSIGGGGGYGCYFCTYSYNFLDFPTGSLSKTCQSGNGFIIYTKGYNALTQEGILTLEFGSYTGPNNDRQKYIDYWNQAVTYYYLTYTKCGTAPSGIPPVTSEKYYQFIRMAIPQDYGSPVNGGPDTPCGDNIVFKTDILLHPSSIMDTSVPDSITWRIPIITNQYVPLATDCGACSSTWQPLVTIINLANTYTQSTEGPIQNNFGAIYDGGASISPFYQNFGPFFSAILMGDYGPSLPFTSSTTSANFLWSNPTYDTSIIKYTQTLWPFSGTPSVSIPSLSGEVCDYSTTMALEQTYNFNPIITEPYNYPNIFAYRRFNYWYNWYLVDPNVDERWFRIVTKSINSLGQLTGPEIIIFERDSNSIIVPPTDPTYWDCIGPLTVKIGPTLNYVNSWSDGSTLTYPWNYYFSYCPSSLVGWNIPIQFRLTNGYSNTDVLNWEILAEDLSQPGTSPSGYFVRWNVTNIPPTQNVVNISGPSSTPFQVGTIVGPTDAGCPTVHGWCGPCYTTGPTPIKITITANLTLTAGGGSVSNYVQFNI